MSEETTKVENQEEVVAPEFNKEDAIEESKNFLADLLLTDPQTQNKLFVATNVQMNEDGSVSIVCVNDVDSDTAIMHTIYSGYVKKAGSEQKEESNIITPKSGLIGLDGQPLS